MDHSFKSELEPAVAMTPLRLRAALMCIRLLQTGGVHVIGGEYIDEIPSGSSLVVATSHLTDLDVPVATSALGRHLDLAITYASTNKEWKYSIIDALNVRVAGNKNLLPVDYKKTGPDSQRPVLFNPGNFAAMTDAMKHGKSIVMAAQVPSKTRELARPSVGVSYLAALTGALVLPVSVRLESDNYLGMPGTYLEGFIERPEASVQIGKPFSLANTSNAQRLVQLLGKRVPGQRMNPQERQEFFAIATELRENSVIVLDALKVLVPGANLDH